MCFVSSSSDSGVSGYKSEREKQLAAQNAPAQAPVTRSQEQIDKETRDRRTVYQDKLRRLAGLRSTFLSGGAGVTQSPTTARQSLLGL